MADVAGAAPAGRRGGGHVERGLRRRLDEGARGAAARVTSAGDARRGPAPGVGLVSAPLVLAAPGSAWSRQQGGAYAPGPLQLGDFDRAAAEAAPDEATRAPVGGASPEVHGRQRRGAFVAVAVLGSPRSELDRVGFGPCRLSRRGRRS